MVGGFGIIQVHYIYCALYFYYYISFTSDHQALDPEGWALLNHGVLEGEKEKGAKNIFEDIIDEIPPNLGKETDVQVQEAERLLNRITQRRSVLGVR